MAIPTTMPMLAVATPPARMRASAQENGSDNADCSKHVSDQMKVHIHRKRRWMEYFHNIASLQHSRHDIYTAHLMICVGDK